MKRLLAAALLALASPVAAEVPKSWVTPIAPFPIVPGIYYVGMEGLASYLIVSGGDMALLDATLPENIPTIEANIRTLGFDPKRIGVLINTHAHYDHSGGFARLKHDTGAKLYAAGPDVWALEHGQHRALNENGQTKMPPVKVDHVLHDREVVRVGALALKAILTPGHTAGCTSWATTVVDRGRALRVLMPCSLTVAGNYLRGNSTYPTIVRDFRATFAKLDQVRADVVLSAHPEISDVLGREARVKAGERDAFIDPTLLPTIVTQSRAEFEKERAASGSK